MSIELLFFPLRFRDLSIIFTVIEKLYIYIEKSNNRDVLDIRKIYGNYVRIRTYIYFHCLLLLSADDCGITDPTAYSNMSVQ